MPAWRCSQACNYDACTRCAPTSLVPHAPYSIRCTRRVVKPDSVIGETANEPVSDSRTPAQQQLQEDEELARALAASMNDDPVAMATSQSVEL